VLLAARAIARRVREAGHRSILAGIGQSFAAARLAKLLLLEDGTHDETEILIETGLCAVDVEQGHPFLLSQQNAAAAERLSSIEGVLGTLVCGGRSSCLGVLGAAQIDPQGNINSSFVADELLVGSGGASDIAASAPEVMVLTRSDRLVPRVEYVTSPGPRVRTVVTEQAVFERDGGESPWTVREVHPDVEAELASFVARCPWPWVTPLAPGQAPGPSALERTFLQERLS
jgi:acyl CoA:acetate/3-ketoacid CoA transferase beta subunit